MTMGNPDFARAIDAMHDEFADAANAGDTERLVSSFYAEEARLLPPNHALVSGRAQIRDFFQGMIGAGVGEFSARTLECESSGDLAYVVGTYTLGKPEPDTGKFIEIHRRQADGSWRCVADIFNSDLPAEQS